jgi:hypothetical protein
MNGLRALYERLYFCSLATIASTRAIDIVSAVDREDATVSGIRVAAQFVVSVDPPERFDADLSMREPLELQVWSDGSFVVEIEFVGPDVRTDPEAGDAISALLGEWSRPRGWRLLSVVNDRARSLPDVWNASFRLVDTDQIVAEAVDFARRAIGVAETHRYGGRFIRQLLETIGSGDVDGLVGTPVTSVFQPRAALAAGPVGDFDLAVDVCAFANATHGGLIVVGLDLDTHGRVARVCPVDLEAIRGRITNAVQGSLFPAPDGLEIHIADAGSGHGVVAIHVPAQDRVLKPFLVHGTVTGKDIQQVGVTLAERRDATIFVHSVAALHSQLAAGRALLAGNPDPPA